MRAAGANAMRDLLKQVKGKRFTTAHATIRFGTVGDEQKATNVILVNPMATPEGEHLACSPLKYLGQPKKMKRTAVRL